MVQIIGLSDLKLATPQILDASGNPLPASETQKPADQPNPLTEPLDEEKQALVMAEIARMLAQLEELKKPAKNHVAGKAKSVTYTLMTQTLNSWGKVPQQQADIADILTKNMKVGDSLTEAQVFELVEREAPNYESIRKSVQHPTYLFRYYRGLKHEGKHAGFVARGFLRAA